MKASTKPALMLAALLLAGCTSSTPIEPPASELLEGGAPVRIGGAFSQLERFQSRVTSDDGSSLLSVEIREGAFQYSYWPFGGIELGAAQPFAYLGMACVGQETPDTTWAPALADRMRVKLGGRWRKGPPPHHGVAWIREDDVRVRYSLGLDFSDVCVMRHAAPEP